MPKVPEGCKLALWPRDDFNHAPDPAPNYNESMYFSVFDAEARLGGWCRIGNRVNEGFAEVSVCLYLPDGRVAFMATRPAISSNERMDAGGLRFEVEEPFERIRVSYAGPVCLLAEPREMADPSRAFRTNPRDECRLDMTFRAATPAVGGELVRLDGTPLPEDPQKGFARAHYDQFMAGDGKLEIGEERWEPRGHGLRDKSWGPRYWQNIDWYRWIHVWFGPELGLCMTVRDDGDGRGVRPSGFAVTPEGIEDLEGGEVESDWDADCYHTRLALRGRTARRGYALEGRVLSLIPLRNRRALPDGRMLVTRISEALTEYRFEGRSALGISEYLDQIVDGRPSGVGRG